MPRVVLATRNQGKVREFAVLLEPLGWEILSLHQVGYAGEIEETGSGYEENARLKAVTVARATGLWALGDDSGLEVEALGGGPGLYSARFAGEGASDRDNCEKLLRELKEVGPQHRGAQFVAVIALAAPDGRCSTFKGECLGRILQAARGAQGFGYDPLFFVDSLGQSLAEATEEAKNRVSHRGRAVQRLREGLGSQRFFV